MDLPQTEPQPTNPAPQHQPGVDDLAAAFLSYFGEMPIAGLADLTSDQLVWLEHFKAQNKQMEALGIDLSEISKTYYALPEYIAKAAKLKEDMQTISEKTKELKERAANVQHIKNQRKLADAQLLAQPSSSLNTSS